MESAPVVGILLAAGSGSRFGADKLLHPIDGLPMAAHSGRHLRAALPKSVAVVRHLESPVAHSLRQEGLQIVVCDQAHSGMGASLACGVAASDDAAGWLIALADMPFVRPATCAAVAMALAKGAVLAAPQYQGRRGHPVAFGRRFREELLALRGDTGARGLLNACAEQLHLLETDDPGVLQDVDLPADLPAAP